MEGSERAWPTAADVAGVTASLDAVVAAARACRGLVVVREAGDLLVLAARSDRRRDLSPTPGYDRVGCDQAFATGERVVRVDVDRRWVFVTESTLPWLGYLLVECTPLKHGADTIAVVYLESSIAGSPPGESPEVRAAIEALDAALSRLASGRA